MEALLEQAKNGGRLGDPQMYSRLYSRLAEGEAPVDPIERIAWEPYLEVSQQMDLSGLQDSAAFRNVSRARALAGLLIDDKGKLSEVQLDQALAAWRRYLYSIGPGRHNDGHRQGHMLRVLSQLKGDLEARQLLLSLPQPSHTLGEALIRATLELSPGVQVTVAHVRRAALSAWLTYLRQNVGSCFGTAPAILIQREQPRQLLRDLHDLLTIGSLRRVVEGEEYSVPLSSSWGQGDLLQPIWLSDALAFSPGFRRALPKHDLRSLIEQIAVTQKVPVVRPVELLDLALQGRDPSQLKEAKESFKSLTDNALLKAWEFTLASFAEPKLQFSRWNLYISLGFQPEEVGGIGQVMVRELQQALSEANRKVEELNRRYEQLYVHAKLSGERLKRSPSEEEARWRKMDYQRKVTELDSLVEEREKEHQFAARLADLFPGLVDRYSRLIPDYFQEAYDPELQEVTPSPFDDSPAGFRLLYKHGRSDPAAWSWISSAEEFIDALVSFFTMTEPFLSHEKDLKGLERVFSAIITAVVNHLRSSQFLETALLRMERARQKKGAESGFSKGNTPWAYVSGGTMAELVSCYYGRSQLPTLRERAVESPTDLCDFLLEVMKELPGREQTGFTADPLKSMLIQSPTHAFTLKPGLPPFRDGWLDQGNTPSWVREYLVRPQQDAIHRIELGEREMHFLLDEFQGRLPPPVRHLFRRLFSRLPGNRMRVVPFRRYVMERLQTEAWVAQIQPVFSVEEEFDRLLYMHVPFSTPNHLRGLLKVLEIDPKIVDSLPVHPIMSARQLYNAVLTLVLAHTEQTTAPQDLAWGIRQQMRALHLALPVPFLFADTNWVRDYFAFVVSPGTGELELWRTDYLGLDGAPMTRWKEGIAGSSEIPWAVYSHPGEYTAG